MSGAVLSVFRGVSEVSLDEKGRLAVPIRFRACLKEISEGELVLTIDTESACLLIYPTPFWNALQTKIEALPGFMPEVRRIQRLLIGHATDVTVDKTGRILVPPMLRDYAGLSKTGVLLGQGEKMELWDKACWQNQRDAYLRQSSAEAEIPEILKKLSL